MAGFSRMYVLGDQGGFMGADGANPIHLLVLVGDASRQWLEPRYLDDSFSPLGAIGVIVPKAPNHPDNLLSTPSLHRGAVLCPSCARGTSGFACL